MPLKGRPIVSGVDSLTQNVSVYVDCILQNFVRPLPSNIRDTSDMLMKMGVSVDERTKLASIDAL